MVGDPGHLLGVQARVDGVQHTARAAHTKVQLQVAVPVPSQRGDAGTLGHLLRIQRVGHLARAAAHIGPGVAVDIPFHPTRNDLAVTVVLLGKFDH